MHQALKQVIERYEVTDIALDEAELEDVMRAAYAQAGDDLAADMAAEVAGDVAAQTPAQTQGG